MSRSHSKCRETPHESLEAATVKKPTHVVTYGKYRANCYLDNYVLRDINTHQVQARQQDGKWNRPVKRIPDKRPSDLVFPLLSSSHNDGLGGTAY